MSVVEKKLRIVEERTRDEERFLKYRRVETRA